MSTWAVLAPGPSLTAALADRVRHLPTVAVCDAYRLAPWADVLVAQDIAWWRARPEAMEFAGRKVSALPLNGRIEPTEMGPHIQSGSNSGLVGIDVARRAGAAVILLIGFDLHGTHYFGPHVGLKNTDEKGFAKMQVQFENWAKGYRGVRVINCTPGSALRAFPLRSLDACLAESAD